MTSIKLICTTLAASLSLLSAATETKAQTAQEVLPLTTDDLEMYRSWDKWQIFSNNTRGHCLGTKSDESGVLQMGVTADETMGYVGVFVKAEVEPGESNAIAVKLGDEIFVGKTSGPVGNLGDGWHGGYILANNQDFLKALEANDMMTAFPDQPYSVELNITGSNNAIYEISQCSQKLGS
ncbi:MAG: hypothetical protein AAF686_00210 [Pseudomonadota bacterium]